MLDDIKDKNSQPIHEGDSVWTKIRGGHREGVVQKIVRTEEEAQEEDVKHPPKVSIGSNIVVSRRRDQWLINEDCWERFSWISIANYKCLTGSLPGPAWP